MVFFLSRFLLKASGPWLARTFHEGQPSGRASPPLAALPPRFLLDVDWLPLRLKLVGRLASDHPAVPGRVAARTGKFAANFFSRSIMVGENPLRRPPFMKYPG